MWCLELKEKPINTAMKYINCGLVVGLGGIWMIMVLGCVEHEAITALDQANAQSPGDTSPYVTCVPLSVIFWFRL